MATHVRLFWVLLTLVLLPGLAAAGVTPTKSPQQSIDDLPLAGRYTISASMGRGNPAYHLQNETGVIKADNPAQSYRMGFSSKGVEIRSGENVWGLSLESWGYGEDQSPVPAAEPQSIENRVEYRRGALTEWYVNGPCGLQQGFTLARAPRGERPKGAGLRLCLNLAGGLTARVDQDRRGLSLCGAGGAVVYRYGGLTVLDAEGREAKAWLEVEGHRLAILVDDQDLRYPLMIDPLIQQTKLTASDGGVAAEFGYSVAVSGDTVVVGAQGDDEYGFFAGAAYVFVKPSGGWSGPIIETAKLTASDGEAYGFFGYSVSVSGDTVVVGADSNDMGWGAAYVFVKPEAGWSGSLTETAKLTASDRTAGDRFGTCVSISGDTVVGGAKLHDDGHGSVYVFVKPEAGWSNTTETAKLTASDGAENDGFGRDVSVSGDTVVVGAGDDDAHRGSAYVFVKPTDGWASTSAFAAKLAASDGTEGDYFGISVSISGDTVVVGAHGDDDNGDVSGAAYVFVKPEAGWSGSLTETAKLTASDGAATDYFGWGVSISGDTVVVGADHDDDNGDASGSAYVFIKPEVGWSTMTQTQKLTASDGAEGDWFGFSVSISGDTVVVGAMCDDDKGYSSGSAYVFDPKRRAGLVPLGLLLLD